MSKISFSFACLLICCDLMADGMDHKPGMPNNSCDLSPIIIKSDLSLPDFASNEQLSGVMRSSFTFENVRESGKDGVLIKEKILMAYYDSLRQKYSSKIAEALTTRMKQEETCELSIVGVKSASNDSAALFINGVAEFKVRKCVGFDYPCGETCEVRWDYQACRTDYCRATQVTNLFDGEARFVSSVALTRKSDTEIEAKINNTVVDQDVSRGELAGLLNKLGISNGSLDALFGSSLPNLANLVESFSVVRSVPQEAYIYKPIIVDAKWELVSPQELQGVENYGIMVQRRQVIERTMACEWISCLRSGPSNSCEL